MSSVSVGIRLSLLFSGQVQLVLCFVTECKNHLDNNKPQNIWLSCSMSHPEPEIILFWNTCFSSSILLNLSTVFPLPALCCIIHTCSLLVGHHCCSAHCVGGLGQVEERRINTRPAWRKKKYRGRENERCEINRHLSTRCVAQRTEVVYERERGEWKDFWSWSSVTTGCFVTEITLNLPLLFAQYLCLIFLCVCVCICVFALVVCHLAIYITRRQAHRHTHTRSFSISSSVPERNFCRLLLYTINQWWPPVKTCPVTVYVF